MGNVGFAGGPARFPQRHHGGRHAILLGYPGFYSDSDYNDSGEGAQPQVVVVQAPVQPRYPRHRFRANQC